MSTRVDPAADLTFATIDTLARGGIKDIFNAEFQKLLENVLDINTDAEAKRSVTLTVEVTPTETRDEATVTIKAKSKLAPFRGAACRLMVARRRGTAVATVTDPKAIADRLEEEGRPKAISSASGK